MIGFETEEGNSVPLGSHSRGSHQRVSHGVRSSHGARRPAALAAAREGDGGRRGASGVGPRHADVSFSIVNTS